MKSLIVILILTISSFAQLDYGPQATNKDAAVRMHFAIKLFRGVNKAQETFLLQGIRDRRSISEAEAAQLFSRDELRDVFFGIGREDVSTFREMYDKGRIADKKAVWNTLTKAEQMDARRINCAWGVGYLNLTEAQIDYLLRFSKALPDTDDFDAFQLEAISLFSPKDAKILFGSIGPYEPCKEGLILMVKYKPYSLLPSCWCNRESYFNVSCDGPCLSPLGKCYETEEGCGFAWLYRCNGWCS